jgi:hypothetical protein
LTEQIAKTRMSRINSEIGIKLIKNIMKIHNALSLNIVLAVTHAIQSHKTIRTTNKKKPE